VGPETWVKRRGKYSEGEKGYRGEHIPRRGGGGPRKKDPKKKKVSLKGRKKKNRCNARKGCKPRNGGGQRQGGNGSGDSKKKRGKLPRARGKKKPGKSENMLRRRGVNNKWKKFNYKKGLPDERNKFLAKLKKPRKKKGYDHFRKWTTTKRGVRPQG